jgi:hypothetical protein
MSNDHNPWAAENDYNPNAGGQSDVEPEVYDPRDPDRKKRSGCGCVFYGCLIATLVALVLIVAAAVGAYYYASKQVTAFTDEAPAAIPVVEAPPEEVAEVGARVREFTAAAEAGRPAEDLVITANDLNMLIASRPELRGKVAVRIADGLIGATVALPTDTFLPIGMGAGRFLNAEVTLRASLENGALVVTLADAKVKGQSLPAVVLDTLREENLATNVASDPQVAAVLAKFDRIAVENDRVVLRLRRELPTDLAAPQPTATPVESP